MLFLSLGLLLGLCAVSLAPILPTPLTLVALIVVTLWAWWILRSWVMVFCLGWVVGLLWGSVQGQVYLLDRLDPELEGHSQIVTGRVVSLVQRRRDSLRFVIAPKSTDLPKRIRVDWFKPPEQVNSGERWQLTLKLKAPRGAVNPGASDFAGLAMHRSLGAVAYVRDDPGNQRLAPKNPASLSALRGAVVESITKHLKGHSMAAFIRALIVGDRSDLSHHQWRVLAVTGTSHLFAISGLHIGIIAGWAYWLGKVVSALLASRSRFAPYQWGCWLSMLAALSYAALAGFSIPTQRAFITVAAVCVAKLLRRRPVSCDVLTLALCLVLLLDPFAVLSPSFWLSFAAVFVIVFHGHFRSQHQLGIANRVMGVQWIISIGLLPMTLFWFGHVSIPSIAVNLVLVPLFSVVLVPLCFIAVIFVVLVSGIGVVLLRLAAGVLDQVWNMLSLIAQHDWTLWHPGLPKWSLVILAAAVLFWMLPKGWPGRGAAGLLLPLVLVTPAANLKAHDFDLWVFDVGHGLCILLQTDAGVMIYDAGNRWRSGSDSAQQVLIPFLKKRGIRKIDLLVLSHGDQDHVGGAASLMRYAKTERLWIGHDRRLSYAYPNGQLCEAGKSLRLGSVSIRALYPHANGDLQGNNGSCVIRVDSAAGSVLLPGDIEALGEVLTLDSELHADLVVGPHHGSATSSRASWVQATGARYVVFSAGFGNHWGFPRAEVVRRWLANGAGILCTGTSGAILASFAMDRDLALVQQRVSKRRFWHRPARGLVGCR